MTYLFLPVPSLVQRAVDTALLHLAHPIPTLEGYYATRSGLIVRARPSFRGRRLSAAGLDKPYRARTQDPFLRILSPRGGDKDGRLRVNVRHEGRHKVFRVHVLVAQAFWGLPPEPGLVVAHADDDNRNNRPENLRWASCTENNRDLRRNQRARAERAASAASESDDEGLTYEPDPELGF